jgi:hypothetical protein
MRTMETRPEHYIWKAVALSCFSTVVLLPRLVSLTIEYSTTGEAQAVNVLEYYPRFLGLEQVHIFRSLESSLELYGNG